VEAYEAGKEKVAGRTGLDDVKSGVFLSPCKYAVTLDNEAILFPSPKLHFLPNKLALMMAWLCQNGSLSQSSRNAVEASAPVLFVAFRIIPSPLPQRPLQAHQELVKLSPVLLAGCELAVTAALSVLLSER